MFEVVSYTKRFDANKVVVKEKGRYPYIVRTRVNNGQKGYIDEDEQYLNEGNTIAFGQDTATMFYQEKPYFTGDKIKVLRPKYKKFNKKNAQFFLAAMRKPFELFSWGASSYNVEIIKSQKIILPQTVDGNIDFNFMEEFVAELEARRVAELEAYLLATGLKDYTLTEAEEKVLSEFNSIEWKKFDITEIFTVKNTANILSSDIVENSGTTPYLCASAENNGVSAYISYNKQYLEEGNCIFIGGKTFVVSYQKKDFYSNDSHNLALYLNNSIREKSIQFYVATCLYKSLKHKYSWGDSVSKTKIKKDKIWLPSKEKIVDYSLMKNFISAIQKLVIKDVVLYADSKIKATKDMVKTSK